MVLFSLILAEVLAVIEVRTHPEITALERAAFEGDLNRMREVLSLPGQGMAWHAPRYPEWSRVLNSSVDTSRAMTGALLGHQLEAIDLLLDEAGSGGVVGRSSEEPASRELRNVVWLAHDDPDLVQKLLTRYWFTEPPALIANGDRQWMRGMICQSFKYGETEMHSYWRDQMARSPVLKAMIWPDLVYAACKIGSRSVLEELVQMGPGVLGTNDDDSFPGPCDSMYLLLFLEDQHRGDLTSDQWAQELERRVEVFRGLIEVARVEVREQPGRWTSIVDSDVIHWALAWDEPVRRAIVQLIREFGVAEPMDVWQVRDIWAGGDLRGLQKNDGWKWELLIELGVDPAICEDGERNPKTLDFWLNGGVESVEIVRFLLAHGARVNSWQYRKASEPIRNEFDRWLAEQGMTVEELPRW